MISDTSKMENDFKKNMQVTFALYAYNQEKYIREAVKGALAQDFPSIEIILSDDNSSDRTFDIMKDLADAYIGPHKIILIKNIENLGLVQHVNNVLKKASGDIVVHAAGDDISTPDRVKLIYARFLEEGSKTVALFSNAIVIDENSVAKGLFFKKTPLFSRTIEDFKATKRCWALGCSFAFRKNIFQKYGELNSQILQEDGALAFRSLLEGEISFVDTPLVKYRIHGSNISQTDSPKKRLVLQRKSYLMKESWLNDAIASCTDDIMLMKIVREEYRNSRLSSFLFSLPALGYLYNLIRIRTKRLLIILSILHKRDLN